MKRKVLAILVPALLMAGAANAAEIYNKDGNKLDFYGKMVGERIWSNTDESNSENEDTSYARFGVKGETQINSQLTGYGQFEYNIEASKPEGEQGESTRLAFAGLKFADYGSFDYGRNYGVAYDGAAYTDMLVEWGGDSWAATDNFMTQRTNGVATYRNTDFFGMVEGLNFAVQYQGKNDNRNQFKANGDGYSMSVNYNIDGFGFVGVYGKSDRTDEQSALVIKEGRLPAPLRCDLNLNHRRYFRTASSSCRTATMSLRISITISTTLIRVSFWLKGARCWRTFPPPVASTSIDVTQCAHFRGLRH